MVKTLRRHLLFKFRVHLGILLTFLFALSCRGCFDGKDTSSRKNPLLDSKDIQKALAIQEGIREIYREVNPSVIRIETERSVVTQNPFSSDPFFKRFFDTPKDARKQQGLGSGFILDESGHIVTNYHVVDKADLIKIKLTNGNIYEATILGKHKTSDIALLKIDLEEGKKLKPIIIGDSKKVSVGDSVLAIGNPFGLSSILTTGIISSVEQYIDTLDGMPRIQTDAAINPGNSGGPLLNISGEVIGINQLIYSTAQSQGFIGIGFAIPINYAMEIVTKLKEGKEIATPYMGLQVFNNPPQNELIRLGVDSKNGLLIQKITKGSPAEKAGLRPYDFITHIDDKEITSISELRTAITKKGIGKNLLLSLIRNGVSRSVRISIAKAPQDN